MNYEIGRIWINKNKLQKKNWQDFLLSCGIRFEESIDYCVGVYDADTLIATGSLYRNIIKCVAVDSRYQGGEVVSILISHLLSEVISSGQKSCYVYTKPESVNSFINLGFNEIGRIEGQLVFLEKTVNGFSLYIKNLKKQRIDADKVAGIVMNANPFTKGHQYLIEYAAKENDVLHVFVLSEDMSAFPADVRLELVKQGISHLKNVYVHETGDYMVSSKTFPSYFLKEDAVVTKIQAELDATVFKEHIAPSMGITRRYVGEEPLSIATNIYNEAMKEVFNNSVELIIIPRIEQGDEVISATKVRALIADDKTDEIKDLVPEITYTFIKSEQGRLIQEKLKREGY